MKTIAIASDHAGYELKQVIAARLRARGYTVNDFGTASTEPVDYPDLIRPAAISVAAGQNDGGIVLGGSGNGEAIVANKVRGIRAACARPRHDQPGPERLREEGLGLEAEVGAQEAEGSTFAISTPESASALRFVRRRDVPRASRQ